MTSQEFVSTFGAHTQVGLPFSQFYFDDICVWEREYNFYNPHRAVIALYVNSETGDKHAYFYTNGFRSITDDLFNRVIRGSEGANDAYCAYNVPFTRAMVKVG